MLRRLPPLLKTVREGMACAGLSQEKQDEHIHSLNSALAAAFSRRGRPRFPRRTCKLSRSAWMRSMKFCPTLPTSSWTSKRCATRQDTKAMTWKSWRKVAPCPPQPCWVGRVSCTSGPGSSWTTGASKSRFNWFGTGCKKQLALFVTPGGRGVLFQLHRLASFPSGRLAGAGGGRNAHHPSHARRLGQAGCRSRTAVELSR